MADVPLKVNEALERVLLVTLNQGNGKGPVVYLASVDQEIRAEKGTAEQPLLGKETLERALFSRLSEPPAPVASEPPFAYLVGCHRRASDEKRRLPVREEEKKSIADALTFAEELTISYAGMVINPGLDGMFPQPDAARARGPLQLLDALEPQPNGPPLATPDFLPMLVARYESDGLDDIIGPVIAGLPKKVTNMSPLAPFQPYFDLLRVFVAIPATAKLMTRLPNWHCPPKGNGRAAMNLSFMGPFLNISCLPDVFSSGQPPVQEVLKPGMKRHEVESGVMMVRGYVLQVQTALHEALKGLLLVEKGAVREQVLAWMGEFIAANAERGKLHINPLACATHGAFLNFCGVMLRLCAPFLEPTGAKWGGKIDPAYAVSGRLDFSDETRLVATAGEVAQWAEARKAEQQQASPSGSATPGGAAGGFHFVCECFFLTARAMHLGVVKCAALLKEEEDEARRWHEQQAALEAQRPAWAGTPQEPEAERQLGEIRANLQALQHHHELFSVALEEPRLLADALAFYRVAAAWLTRLACPPSPPGGAPPSLPLPSPSPVELQLLPEHLVEDIADFLLFLSRHAPHRLEGERLDEFMDFLVLFTGSPQCVKNPYLRAKFVEVLRNWMPNTDPAGRDSQVQAYTRGLFEAHELSQRCLAHALLSLYVDVEFTGRANTQFYDRMNIRFILGSLLLYLWTVPAHRRSWCALAGRGDDFYLRFSDMTMNDAIYQLDEALKKLPESREMEEQAASGAWASLSPQERAQRAATMRQQIGQCKTYLQMSVQHMRIMRETTAEAACARIFLNAEMVNRAADMLNYFLKFLAGPERRRLRVQDPEKYSWDPKELLRLICGIYLHLAMVDSQDAFAKAVAADGRSYNDACFAEAGHVLRTFSLMPEGEVARLEAFTERVRAFHSEALQEEEDMGEVPDEFLDELMNTVMEDPVRLPSGQVLDRPTIMRHLLSNTTNPFTRGPLSADQLEPLPDLKARIEEFRRNKKARGGSGGGGAAPMDTA